MLETGETVEEASETSHRRSSHGRRSAFLELPGEILSQIASYLPIGELIPYLSLHPSLLQLTRSHLSPLPRAIHEALLAGPPYPHLLSVLPSLRHFLPSDDGRLFVDVLVRARPRWVLERLEMGHWSEETWQEAFERRFLPGWKGFKRDEDSWRAIFLRMLSRLEHRNLGCTHEESWTRFVTIHRNGSAGINRCYSRLFDPYDIYDELKSQNNFASHPTQVRVVVHLQDVRILAIGVLSNEPTLFVNPNAHALLHPPLLRNRPACADLLDPGHPAIAKIPSVPKPSLSVLNGTASNEIYFPLVRTLSPSTPGTTTYGLGEGAAPVQPQAPHSPPSSSASLSSTLARVLPGRRRRNTSADASGPSDSAGLSQVRSRDSDDSRRRSWASAFGRARSGSFGNPLERAISATQPVLTPSPTLPVVGEHSPTDENEVSTVKPPQKHVDAAELDGLLKPDSARPYSTMRKPAPAPAYELYPNFTPTHGSRSDVISDTRALYPEIEDDYNGHLWASDETTPRDDVRMVEWSEERGRRERWVGPMILVAQLYPATRSQPYPSSATPGPTEGPVPDLGPKGMYASLGFEDIKAILPWIDFKGGGAYHAEPMRSGLGYE